MEKAEYAKKVGQLTIQVDWLKTSWYQPYQCVLQRHAHINTENMQRPAVNVFEETAAR